MTEINLLPTKFRAKDTLFKVVKTIKVLNLTGTAVFFILTFGMVFLIIYNQTLLASAQKREEKLEASITALKEVESKYILLKNRAARALVINETENALPAVLNYEVLSKTTEGLLVDNVEIAKSKSSLSLRAQSAVDLARFLDGLLSLGIYPNILMESFSFQPDTGYSIAFEFN